MCFLYVEGGQETLTYTARRSQVLQVSPSMTSLATSRILDPRPSPLWMYSYAQYLALSTYNNANEAAEKPYSCPVEPGLLQMTATSEKQQRQTDRLSHKHYLSLTS